LINDLDYLSNKGTLYADTLDEALAAAVDDIEAMYSDERLQSLVGRAVSTIQSVRVFVFITYALLDEFMCFT
jgi:hypothetical protein